MGWRDRFDAEKLARGYAPAGSVSYQRNAAHILSHCPDRTDTRAKMNALAESTDRETRSVARQWLSDHDYQGD